MVSGTRSDMLTLKSGQMCRQTVVYTRAVVGRDCVIFNPTVSLLALFWSPTSLGDILGLLSV